jgi:lysozyme
MPQIDILDISHWQSDNKAIDFLKVKKALPNLKGIIIKATQGNNSVDKRLIRNYEGAKTLNVPISFYHFMSSTTDGVSQAKKFLDTINSLDGFKTIKKLIPALDAEEDKIHHPERILKIIDEFIAYCAKNGIPKLLFYSGMSYIKFNLANPKKYASHPLWLAYYSKNRPQTHKWYPTQWDKNFALWQFAAQPIPGFAGNVDVNQLNPNFDFNSIVYI